MGAYNPIVIHSLHLAFLLSLLLSACASTRAQSCTAYTVQSGDTCYNIAQANSISLSDFESWNAGINCDNLQIGQSVCVSAPSSSSSSPSSSSTNGNVLREYIGAEWKSVSLTSMPIISTNVEVHYILSFAIDYTSDSSSPSPTNGNFAPFWDTDLTPASVKAIKAQYANVKVMLSLGGDTVGQDNTHVQFQPTSVSTWVSNAVSSLTSLVQQYGLDGIDVDYEHFDSITNNEDFSSAIGQLITQLKQQNVISVASIAPFDGVAAPYSALWAKYSSVFDYVNFQFYTYGKSTTVAEYITHYNTAAATYSGGKVLASFTTADAADSVTPTNALDACKQLQASNSLPGIFIWSADDSYVSTAAPNFEYEQQAQKLLAAA